METDPTIIIQRIAVKVIQFFTTYHHHISFIFFMIKVDDGTFTEQSVKQVFQSAKENLKWSLLK